MNINGLIQDVMVDIEYDRAEFESFANMEIENYVRDELSAMQSDLQAAFVQSWIDYQSSYSPLLYIRSHKTVRGIQASGSPKKTAGDKYEVLVTFEDSRMVYSNRHTYQRISDGWGSYGARYRYDYYEGHGQFGMAISDFFSKWGKHKWFDLIVDFSGSKTTYTNSQIAGISRRTKIYR